jgi:hypothetical protein
MEERIEAFLADVLALGRDENTIRDGVRVALADYEQIFRPRKSRGTKHDERPLSFEDEIGCAVECGGISNKLPALATVHPRLPRHFGNRFALVLPFGQVDRVIRN